MNTDLPPFFILGLPRCRTAWLSVVCTMAGAPCTHEGMRGFDDFESYAAGRLMRGDSDPALCFWLAEILERWPDARFVVVERNDGESLVSLLKAAPEELRAGVAANWHTVSNAFSMARDLLRDDARTLMVRFEELADNGVIARILRHVGVACVPSDETLTKWQRLRVTSEIVAGASAPRLPALPGDRVRASEVCDVAGLHAELYERADFGMVADWWRVHTGQVLQESALPPLGVRVSKDGVPLACIWCYECFGVPVAELVFPVTRPGLGVGDARRALLYAISCIIEAAGKGHVPEARFSRFRASVPAGLVRYMERIGFVRRLGGRVPMLLSL